MTLAVQWEPDFLGEGLAQQGTGTDTGVAAWFCSVRQEILGLFEGRSKAGAKEERNGGA